MPARLPALLCLCLSSALGLGALGCARGPDPGATALPSLPETPLDDDDDYDDLDDDPEPSLDARSENQVRQAYSELARRGVLGGGWHFKERLPPLSRSARLRMAADADAGIADGYTRFVVVPLDAQDAPCGTFYITREGGFSGWTQWLGPFGF